ncbi:VCBS repeat-containing protein [Streptomyces bambusae]|uniref:FG-GAP repeat domain-containing protein n=1 Tax=Streptomyces bambusae TaxID=1550616 RepID=UPI001CFD6DBB|nr:VCBS repeat-containing protein [Streptomyces bambusae]MCB5164923.1 VCBS repeat-containing protein [Streptomyces bambusae]
MDFDADGISDRVFRQLARVGEQYTQVLLSGSKSGSAESFLLHNDYKEWYKDLVPAGNLAGSAAPELLTLSYDGRLSLLQTNGRMTTAPTWSGKGWQVYNRVVGTGDLTKDGKPDLLARTPSGELFLYRGTGSITTQPFAPRVKVGGGWSIYDQVVGSNDLDADGVADLIARTPKGDLYFYKGTGSATAPFKPAVRVGTGWQIYNQVIGADDLNGDGRADLMARAFSGSMYCYYSTGPGKFAARTSCGAGWQDTELFLGSGITPSYGKHELVGIDRTNRFWFLTARANGTFTEPFSPYPADFWPAGAKLTSATGLDVSGYPRSFALTASGLVNKTTGTPIGGNWSKTNLVVGPGDLTGDGMGDLLSRDSTGTLWLHAGNGTANVFATPVKVGTGWGRYTALVGSGDVSGDGRPDLVGRSGDSLYLFPGTGSTAAPFGARVLVGTGWSAYTALAAPGDINGDGRTDLVARDAAGTLYRFTATGLTGTAAFTARAKISTGWNGYTQLH